jgi:hypothetical protein
MRIEYIIKCLTSFRKTFTDSSKTKKERFYATTYKSKRITSLDEAKKIFELCIKEATNNVYIKHMKSYPCKVIIFTRENKGEYQPMKIVEINHGHFSKKPKLECWGKNL